MLTSISSNLLAPFANCEIAIRIANMYQKNISGPTIDSKAVSNNDPVRSSGAPSSYNNWFGDDGSWRRDPARDGAVGSQ